MRKLNILSVIILSIISLIACNENKDYTELDNNLAAPKLSLDCSQDFVVKETTNQKEQIGTWEWTKGDFNIASPVRYTVVVDTINTFASEKVIATYSEHSKAQPITIEMLNTAAAAFTKKSKPVKLYIAVKSYLGTSGNRGALYSNVETISFTCFYFKVKDVLYMVGDGLIDFSNTTANIGKGLQVLFANTNGSDDLDYTYTSYFKGGKGLKFPTIAGDDSNVYGAEGSKLVLNGGNYIVPQGDGLYTLSINLATKDISMAKYIGSTDAYEQMDILGDFSSWTSGTPISMTQIAPHVWVAPKAEISKDGGIKMRANKAWAKSWGFKKGEVRFPYGISTTEGGENIPLKTGNYYIALNDITGHYIILPVNELPQKK